MQKHTASASDMLTFISKPTNYHPIFMKRTFANAEVFFVLCVKSVGADAHIRPRTNPKAPLCKGGWQRS